MSDEQEAPKIQIDSDWKAEAQAEKERLAEEQAPDESAAEAADGGDAGAAGAGRIPPASFETLISTMATQSVYAMGGMMGPGGQRLEPDMELARHHIDSLAVIEEKTKGNLTEEESKMLVGTLYELRQRYIAIGNAQRGA